VRPKKPFVERDLLGLRDCINAQIDALAAGAAERTDHFARQLGKRRVSIPRQRQSRGGQGIADRNRPRRPGGKIVLNHENVASPKIREQSPIRDDVGGRYISNTVVMRWTVAKTAFEDAAPAALIVHDTTRVGRGIRLEIDMAISRERMPR